MIACLEMHAYVTSCLHRCMPRGLMPDGPRGISVQVTAPTSLSHPKHTTNMSSMLGPVQHCLCLAAAHSQNKLWAAPTLHSVL